MRPYRWIVVYDNLPWILVNGATNVAHYTVPLCSMLYALVALHLVERGFEIAQGVGERGGAPAFAWFGERCGAG